MNSTLHRRLALTVSGAAALAWAGAALGQDSVTPAGASEPVPQIRILSDIPIEGPVVWPRPTNAAPIYWRAFHTFSTTESFKGVDFSELYVSDDDGGYLLTGDEVKRLEGTRGIIEIALRASRAPNANWEIDYDLGIGALLPHLGPMRNMARLFCADVRRCVTEGDVEGGVQRFEALHAMARHLQGDGILISSLVSAAIANLAVDQASQFLAQVALTPEQQARMIAALDAYGADDPVGIRQAIQNEGVWLTAWLAEQIRDGKLRHEMDMLFSLGDGSDAGQIERLKRMGDDALIEDLRGCRRYYQDAVNLWTERDAPDRLSGLETLVQEGHYGQMARVLAAALGKSHTADLRTRAAIERGRSEILADPTAPAAPEG